jgi:hypothetical protein
MRVAPRRPRTLVAAHDADIPLRVADPWYTWHETPRVRLPPMLNWFLTARHATEDDNSRDRIGLV